MFQKHGVMFYNKGMAMILNKKDNMNDELSKRITADLRAKAVESSLTSNPDPDFVDDSEYVKDFEKTGRFGWVWAVLVVAVIVVMAILLIK